MRWFWGYKEGYKKKRITEALEMGTGIHFGLERYYGAKESPVKAFEGWADKRIKEINPEWDDDIEKMKEIRVLGSGMLKGYREHYNKDAFEVLATEHTLTRPLPIPGTSKFARCKVVVRLDGLVRCLETKRLFSLEHKSFKRFRLADLDIDHQFTAQVWAGQDLADTMGLNESVVGVIWNGLRKQLPGPKVKSALFERHKLYRNQNQINAFLFRAYNQYRAFLTGDVYAQPNSFRCMLCDFREPCVEYQRGGDYQFLLDEMYTKRQDDEITLNTVELSDID